MTSVIHNVPDVTTFAANVVVFLAAVAAAVAGSMTAVKAIKKSWSDLSTDEDNTKTTVASAMIIETTTVLMLSESQRDLAKATDELRFAIVGHRDETRELRACIDKLMEVINRKM